MSSYRRTFTDFDFRYDSRDLVPCLQGLSEAHDEQRENHALKVAVVAVLTAVVVVFTLVIRIPTTKGYLNLCDVAICFIAFTFGPVSAFLAAGLGAAIADLISGYAQWVRSPSSFMASKDFSSP